MAMKPFSVSPSSCSQAKPCVQWVQMTFRDCLCNLSDEISFAFGLISLICWGVAEIPQIITNFSSKSGHGVSLAFLMTWVVGDVFNLVGCLLEPVTLPTQLYTALLYTASTVVLVLQTIYYDYIRRLWKRRGSEMQPKVDDGSEPLKPKLHDSTLPIAASSPTPLWAKSLPTGLYYTSARSLTSSHTPPFGSYLGIARSGPSAMALHDSSSDDESSPTTTIKTPTKPHRVAHSVGYGTLILTGINLPSQAKALTEGYMRLSGRRLLQEHGTGANVYGIWLGWMMAAIYMGGRIPQICLNIKRKSVEGLNPLMFIFALVANAAYVGSILVRSMEWKRIKANMPWLLDAIVCVVLDLFIILQFVYYKFLQTRTANHEDNYGDYIDPRRDMYLKFEH